MLAVEETLAEMRGQQKTQARMTRAQLSTLMDTFNGSCGIFVQDFDPFEYGGVY